MKRATILVSATLAGLVGVLAFHTTPSQVSLPPLPQADGSPAASPSRPAAPSGHPAASGKPAESGAPAGGTSGGTRSATGPNVNYSYGVLAVKVTVSGSKILNVGIASIDDGGNPYSESIDQRAIPVLEQEVMQVQSANVQAVSGASYTSAGFTQSLQAALHGLGFQ